MAHIYCEWIADNLTIYHEYMGKRLKILEYLGDISKLLIGPTRVGLKLQVQLNSTNEPICEMFVHELRVSENKLEQIVNWRTHIQYIQVVCDEMQQ